MVQKLDDVPRRRGRPRGFDPDHALRAAGERFRVRGYAGTSLDELVDATGLARPSLYAAFGDKKALYLAALAAVTERAARGFDDLAAARLPLDQAVRRLLGYVIHGFLKGERGPAGCIMIGTAPPEATVDPDVRAALARFIALEDDRTADILRAAGSPTPEAHGRLVAAVVHSLSVRARAGAIHDELTALAEDCVALISGAGEPAGRTPPG